MDFLWQTVDELPISMGSFRAAKVEARAFVQIDWSRGGDACVASAEVKTVEDIDGRKSAMMMFSPDHTVFEFMITNSRLTREEMAQVRKNTALLAGRLHLRAASCSPRRRWTSPACGSRT